MVLPKYYNKRLKHGILLLFTFSIIVYSINTYFVKNEISQLALEFHALHQHKVSNFNPRFSTHEILSYINGKSSIISNNNHWAGHGIHFHWDDWVDLSAANKILDSYRSKFPNGKCDRILENYANVNGYYMESHDKKIYRGMADLYCLKEIPSKIIVTTDSSFIEVPVINKQRLGLNNESKPLITKEMLINEMSTFDKTLSHNINNNNDLKIIKYKNLQKQINIPAEDFMFNPESQIFKLQDKLNHNEISSEELNYLHFLEYANVQVDSADRFFKYPWIYTDVVTGRSHHLAYPFFKRYIGDRERQSVIHHMVRAWFKFAESNDFNSWVNYGSLLGWAYNGVNMPWDTDIDIQLPIAQLDRLGREFNRSLILENPRYGNAKYFLEISPTYVRQGNGRNFIDARFIDINSGLYIDISALSHSNFKPPQEFYQDLSPIINDLNGEINIEQTKLRAMPVHCKNWNWHSLEELLPIRHTWFEGASIYIPHNVSRILTRKYGKTSFTTKSHFADHNYQKDINMWVPDSICSQLPSISSNIPISSSNSRFLNVNDDSKLSLNGACNNKILQDEYQIIHECAERHSMVDIDVDHSIDYDINELGDLPLFRKDSWDYFNDINERIVTNENWYIREEVI